MCCVGEMVSKLRWVRIPAPAHAWLVTCACVRASQGFSKKILTLACPPFSHGFVSIISPGWTWGTYTPYQLGLKVLSLLVWRGYTSTNKISVQNRSCCCQRSRGPLVDPIQLALWHISTNGDGVMRGGASDDRRAGAVIRAWQECWCEKTEKFASTNKCLESVHLAGGWWLVCSEREVLLLVADKPNEQCVNLLSYRNQITTVSTERAEPTSILTGDTREQDCLSLLLASMVGEERGEDIRVQENLYKT
jgi:hypothetical protein